jgi:uncharacterized protein (TIGR00661 family)
MARIVYGAIGDGLGHVCRGLAVAQELPQHQFLFLGGGKTRAVEGLGYPFEEIPMPATYYANHRVDIAATVANGLRVLLGGSRIIDRVVATVRAFDPDLVITDYEVFVPFAARRLGIPCISLDNQHCLTKCLCEPPAGQTLSRLLLALPLRHMYSNADRYLITTFFPLQPLDPASVEVFPPVIVPAMHGMVPTEGDHVLVYQTSPTFHRLVPVLERLGQRCIIYGLRQREPSTNLVYKAPSRRGFAEDLASCRYVIANGGHSVIAEALFLGKPVLSFPVHLAYEQFFNAHMLKALGYGDYCLATRPDTNLFRNFEERLGKFRARIAAGKFCGNQELAARLDELACDGRSSPRGF